MKYKFTIWWKDPAKKFGARGLRHIDEITVEAESYKDALDIVAQEATDRTEITPNE